MEQLLTIPGRFFNPDDAENIPTGELRSVEGVGDTEEEYHRHHPRQQPTPKRQPPITTTLRYIVLLHFQLFSISK